MMLTLLPYGLSDLGGFFTCFLKISSNFLNYFLKYQIKPNM